MKHTTEELLLAATVRGLVEKRRLAQSEDMTDEEFAQYMEQPIDTLIAEALAELNRIATIISKIQTA
jgi:hypothetical protein